MPLGRFLHKTTERQDEKPPPGATARGAEEDRLRRSGTQLAGRSTSSNGCSE